MEIVDFLSKLGFVAILFSGFVALMNWRLSLYNAIRADMKSAWVAFKESAGYGHMLQIASVEPEAIVFLSNQRVPALTFLHDLETMASHDRKGRVAWSDIIPNAEYGVVQRAFQNTAPLMVLARNTTVNLELQLWADDRKSALSHVVRAFRRKGR